MGFQPTVADAQSRRRRYRPALGDLSGFALTGHHSTYNIISTKSLFLACSARVVTSRLFNLGGQDGTCSPRNVNMQSSMSQFGIPKVTPPPLPRTDPFLAPSPSRSRDEPPHMCSPSPHARPHQSPMASYLAALGNMRPPRVDSWVSHVVLTLGCP